MRIILNTRCSAKRDATAGHVIKYMPGDHNG